MCQLCTINWQPIKSFSWFFFTKSVKTGNGNICVLCHNSWTNQDTDLFSTLKWPSELRFHEKKWLEIVVKLQFSCRKFWGPPSNYNLDTFSTSKWTSTPKFCERYSCSWHKMTRNDCKIAQCKDCDIWIWTDYISPKMSHPDPLEPVPIIHISGLFWSWVTSDWYIIRSYTIAYNE